MLLQWAQREGESLQANVVARGDGARVRQVLEYNRNAVAPLVLALVWHNMLAVAPFA